MKPIDQLKWAAAVPDECHPGCECLCHDDMAENPGPHLQTCAWAAPDFPEYVWATQATSEDTKR